jgi:uncharacterized sodium:solute symporter family permease YidK
MLFKRDFEDRVRQSQRAAEFDGLEATFRTDFDNRRQAAHELTEARRTGDDGAFERAKAQFVESQAALRATRDQAAEIVKDVTGDRAYSDVNYVFPTFITTVLPVGLTGLMIAAIFAAVMSTISSELNSLSTATIIDFYRRHFNTAATGRHYLVVSKVATGLWGAFACFIATQAVNLGALIEVVNKVGSFFYGSLLGVFVLAVATRANANGALVGLIAGMSTVAIVGFTTNVAYLWQNVIGTAVVVVVGVLVTMVTSGARPETTTLSSERG